MIYRFETRRLIVIAAAIAMIAVIACGTESSGEAAAGDSQPSTENVVAGTEDGSEAAVEPGGIDQNCVNQVLGREASGFGDVTAAERDRIFSECFGDDDGGERPPRLGDGRNRDFQFGEGAAAAIDPECVQGITGSADGGLAQITPEQRQQIFSECAGGDGEAGGFFGGGFGGADGFAAQLPECFTDALGDSGGGLQGLTPEDFQAISEACGDEFGDFGGFGGTGQDGGGFFGGRGGDGGTGGFRGGGGFGGGGIGGGFDLASECVTQVLGRTVESLQDITAEEREQLLQACFGG